MAKKNYQIRIEEELFDKFRFVADKNHRSIIGHIGFLMEEAVKSYEAEHGEIKVNPDDLYE